MLKGKVYRVELVSLRRRTLCVTVLILRTLLFELNVTLTTIFNFTVLLSYRVIRMFLVR